MLLRKSLQSMQQNYFLSSQGMRFELPLLFLLFLRSDLRSRAMFPNVLRLGSTWTESLVLTRKLPKYGSNDLKRIHKVNDTKNFWSCSSNKHKHGQVDSCCAFFEVLIWRRSIRNTRDCYCRYKVIIRVWDFRYFMNYYVYYEIVFHSIRNKVRLR